MKGVCVCGVSGHTLAAKYRACSSTCEAQNEEPRKQNHQKKNQRGYHDTEDRGRENTYLLVGGFTGKY